MGVLAAFVFAAQLLNFPVLGGTSGHLMGGALLGILLGPTGALLTMATVIIAQALFLQDGGIVALGANIFNIGALTVLSGVLVFRALGGTRGDGKRLALAAFLAGWVSSVLSAISCALLLALSGTIALGVGLPAMAGYHAVIGVAEGGLTAGILQFLARVRPELLLSRDRYRFGPADWIGALVLVGIPFTIFALAGSSSLPDPLQSLIAPGFGESENAAETALAASGRYADTLLRAGAFAVFILIAYAVTRWAGRRSRRA